MDHCLPSQTPPKGLPVSAVPQFVTIGFDDNGYSGKNSASTPHPYGLEWACQTFSKRVNPEGKKNPKTYDGRNGRCTFFFTTGYVRHIFEIDPPDMVKRAWYEAVHLKGHEGGVHTHSHPDGRKLSVETWLSEMDICIDWLTRPEPASDANLTLDTDTLGAGLERKLFSGFRSPYLHYNDNTLTAASQRSFLYDCSIEEGWQINQDGSNFVWPYTLDEGSPGNLASFELDNEVPLVGKHPGLWEMPVHTVIVPPDELCEKYGVMPGLRKSIADRDTNFNPENGKVTGLDWNCLVDCQMNKSEFLATLKYTFDCRYEGNRCPLIFGGHSDVYSDGYVFPPCITAKERQEALEEFLDYTLTKKEVRIVAIEDIIAWMKDPATL